MKERLAGLFLMTAHMGAYAFLLFLFLPVSWAIAFALVHWGMAGIYFCFIFAPNHKGMLIVKAEEQFGFLERQLYTTRNVRGGLITDILTGGLNYQIEHHLWPAMPRGNLRKAAAIVQDFCRVYGLRYHSINIGDSYREVSQNFSRIGKTLAGGLGENSAKLT